MVQPVIIWTLYWGADRVKTLLCLIQLIHLHSNVHLLWVMSRKVQGFSMCVERAFLCLSVITNFSFFSSILSEFLLSGFVFLRMQTHPFLFLTTEGRFVFEYVRV